MAASKPCCAPSCRAWAASRSCSSSAAGSPDVAPRAPTGVGLERADALGRPVGRERVPDDPVDRDRAPEAAVVGRAAVVAHAEDVALWDGDRARQVTALPAGARCGERLALELPV